MERSDLVAKVMVFLVLCFLGTAYYWWRSQDRSGKDRPITGVVMDKSQRPAGTEAGDKPLQQGMRVLSGQSLQQEMFYVIHVWTQQGQEVDMEVPYSFYRQVEMGDKIHRASPSSPPTIVR